ncbi:unnamed protein product [Arctogadus glacialis]
MTDGMFEKRRRERRTEIDEDSTTIRPHLPSQAIGTKRRPQSDPHRIPNTHAEENLPDRQSSRRNRRPEENQPTCQNRDCSTSRSSSKNRTSRCIVRTMIEHREESRIGERAGRMGGGDMERPSFPVPAVESTGYCFGRSGVLCWAGSWGAVVVFQSGIPQEVLEWNKGGLRRATGVAAVTKDPWSESPGLACPPKEANSLALVLNAWLSPP